jgi:hypothetical protein
MLSAFGEPTVWGHYESTVLERAINVAEIVNGVVVLDQPVRITEGLAYFALVHGDRFIIPVDHTVSRL